MHKLIDEYYDNVEQELPRRYIGASGISECEAEIALSLRGFPNTKPAPRFQRIFRLGHIIEDIVVHDLKRAGYNVEPVDPVTKEQWAYRQFGGHIKCHLDGKITLKDGRVAVLEIKSMNASSWNKFVKHGIQKSHPIYYRQMQTCMGMAEMEHAVMVAYNKNTSEYHTEVVEFDENEAALIEERIVTVLENNAIKIATTPSYWKCKGCFKRQACWDGVEVAPGCATCKFSRADELGDWRCEHDGKIQSAEHTCPAWTQYEPLG